MLPLLHRQRYLEFQQALQQLHSCVTATHFEMSALRDIFQEVQQVFQTQITTLSADDLAPDYTSRWQSIQTEVYKQMRLLQTDTMLLLSSRSWETSQRRIVSVCDRIKTLIQYCEVLLQL